MSIVRPAVRQAVRPITRSIVRGAGETFDVTGLSLSVDFWIDATTGDDTNDGLTAETAWATLSKISSFALPAGETRTVRVVSGTYDTAAEYILVNDISSGGAPGAGSKLNVVFEPGCVVDGTAVSALPPLSPSFCNIGGTNANCTVFGNGLEVRNFSEATAHSPEGFGTFSSGILTVYRAHCINCDDGFSAHATSQMYLYDCSAQGSEKGPFLHVESAKVRAYRCEFYRRAGGSPATLSIVGGASTCDIECHDCKFIPEAESGQATIQGKFYRCQFGNPTTRLLLASSSAGDGIYLEECYGNFLIQTARIQLKRCYGRMSARVEATRTIRVENCVFGAQSSTGQMVYSNFNPGSSGPFFWRNNICRTTTAAGFMNVDSTNAGYLVAANAEFFNNCLAGSAAFDADLIAADTGGTVIVDNITADPLIGVANTLNPDDYGYAPGSPCIGAGVGGTNIGFAIGEVSPPAPLIGTVPTP
jgi:hypothetical protein